MDINNKNPEDVIKKKFLKTYEKLHSDIWKRLTHIHTNIIILEQMEKFPFDKIYPPSENIFWYIVGWNIFCTNVVLIHALVNDKGNDCLTIQKFRNYLLRDWLLDSERKEFCKISKGLYYDRKIEQIGNKISDIRTKIIAHNIIEPKCTFPEVEGVTFSEIKKLFKEIEALFLTCSFGTKYVSSFYVDCTSGGKPVKKDIEIIFELIAKDSYWLNEPERNPQAWKAARTNKLISEIQELNQWRKRCGLPEV